MKKFALALGLLVSSFGFIACSSDDDATPVDNNPMVGDWKAVDLSYTMPNGETHTFPFASITGGCDVDEIELRANNSAELEIENKVEDVCTEQHISGTWNDEVITFDGVNPKYVVSVDATTLVLKYEMTYGNFGTIEVTVSYARD